MDLHGCLPRRSAALASAWVSRTRVKLGVVLVKLRIRLLGPLATIATLPKAHRSPAPHNSVDAAFREVDVALDHLSAALGLKPAA